MDHGFELGYAGADNGEGEGYGQCYDHLYGQGYDGQGMCEYDQDLHDNALAPVVAVNLSLGFDGDDQSDDGSGHKDEPVGVWREEGWGRGLVGEENEVGEEDEADAEFEHSRSNRQQAFDDQWDIVDDDEGAHTKRQPRQSKVKGSNGGEGEGGGEDEHECEGDPGQLGIPGASSTSPRSSRTANARAANSGGIKLASPPAPKAPSGPLVAVALLETQSSIQELGALLPQLRAELAGQVQELEALSTAVRKERQGRDHYFETLRRIEVLVSGGDRGDGGGGGEEDEVDVVEGELAGKIRRILHSPLER